MARGVHGGMHGAEGQAWEACMVMVGGHVRQGVCIARVCAFGDMCGVGCMAEGMWQGHVCRRDGN